VNLHVDSVDNITVIKLSGRLDTYSAQRLRQQILLMASGPNKNLIVDLAGLDFIDSSGLAAIVQGMKQCRAGGGDLRLCRPPQAIRMVLELTRLDKALDIFPNHESAIHSFATHPGHSKLHTTP
jgi:anti-sigma B factor antagonist